MSQLLEENIGRNFQKLPPHSVESEMCLIASLAIDGAERTKILHTINRDIFFQTDHQIFFDVIRALHESRKAVDWLLIREELHRRGLLADVGGVAYISELSGCVPSAAHAQHYAGVVLEKFRLRGIIALANDALRQCYAPADHDASERIASTLAGLAATIAISGSDVPIHHISSVMEEVLTSFDEKKPRRIPVGISDLDHAIGGLPVGGFAIVGGRPGMGKSQLGKQFIRNIAGMGLPCGIVSVEEDRLKIAENFLSQESGVENRSISYRRFKNGDVDQVVSAMPRLAELPIWIVDAANTLASISAAVTILAVKHKARVIFIDYIQLIDGGGRYENKNIEVGKISSGLKHLFKRLDVAGVCAAQLNRSGNEADEAKPSLQRLRDTGTLEQDGDLIMLLWRKDYYHRREEGYEFDDQLLVMIAKNKAGPETDVPLYFDGAHQAVKNYNERPYPHAFQEAR